MTYALGVDVGTTFSAAAVWRDGRAETVPLGNRANAVPSVVLLREDGTLLVGDAAARRAVTEPRRVAREFKRRIGDRVPVLLGDQPIEPERLLAAMVAWIVERVTEREGGPPAHVVLTCPANWGEYRRGLVRDAAEQIGLDNAGILVEPVAAAIQYASLERVEPGALIGVYDFGGGTFDATVLRKTAEGFEIQGTPEGDDDLGGVDFDQAVMAHVAASLGPTWSQLDLTDMATLRAVAQVRANAVEAKEALSTDVEAGIAVILPGVSREVRLTRGEFEDAVRPQLQRTVEVFKQAVVASGIEPAQLHRVLLVGGSSRIPLVPQLLTQQLGVQVALDAHPKYAVCLGAAIAAGTRVAAAQQRPPLAPAPGPQATAVPEGSTAPEVTAPSGPGVALPPGAAVPGAVAAGRSPEQLSALVARRAKGSGDGPDERTVAAEPRTQAFNAIVGDTSSDSDPSDTASVDVDLVDRGLTMPLDITFAEADPEAGAGDTAEADGEYAVRRFDRVQRGGARRPLVVPLALAAVVVLVALVIVWIVTNRRPPADGQQQVAGEEADQDAPPEDDAPPADPTPDPEADEGDQQGPDVVAGRFDIHDLDLTDVTPQQLPGITPGDDAQVENVVTRDGGFVAVGRTPAGGSFDALVLQSPDGQAWQRVDSAALGGDGEQRIFAAADGPDGIVAVGVDGEAPGADGAVWIIDGDQIERVEAPALGGDGYQEIRDVIRYEDRYIAVGCSDAAGGSNVCDGNQTGGQEAAIWVSPDGREWSLLASNAVTRSANASLRGVAPSPAGLVAIGHHQDAGEPTRRAAFWFSADGDSWERIPVGLRDGVLTSSATGVASNDAGVIAVGYDDVGPGVGDKDEAVWFSADGTSWQQVAPDPAGRRMANQVAVDAIGLPDGFVMVGRDFQSGANVGAVWVSPDGRQWQRSYEDLFPVDGTILRHASASAERMVIGGFAGSGVRLLAAPALEDP